MTDEERCRLREQLKLAHDIRKFEIDLYWKRAAYFWTLIGAAFVAFFAAQAVDGLKNRKLLSLIVANLGFVFSLGWYFVNRGSKFWQENWETQVDRLEKCLEEDFYRLVFFQESNKIYNKIYSVSSINICTSIYVSSVWFFLMAWSVMKLTCEDCSSVYSCLFIIFTFASTVIIWCSFYCSGKDKADIAKGYKYYWVKRCVESHCSPPPCKETTDCCNE